LKAYFPISVPSAILFCKEPAIHEVIVTGKKQGATEKHKSIINIKAII